ncbi:hypothetical protein B0A55_12505, partial [Friedmanniomyces simplex]
GGFMQDLNQRLRLGPQGVPASKPKEEGEAEAGGEGGGGKEVLVDARKGRARGPARRRPGASPSGGVGVGAGGEAAGSGAALSFSGPVVVWEIDEAAEGLSVGGAFSSATPAVLASTAAVPAAAAATVEEAGAEEAVVVDGPGDAEGVDAEAAEPADPNTAALERALSDNEKVNTRAPAMLSKSESMSMSKSKSGLAGPGEEGPEPEEKFSVNPPAAVGAEGDRVESAISPAVAEEQGAVQPELEAALAGAEPEAGSAGEAVQGREMSRAMATSGTTDIEGKDTSAAAAATSPTAENARATAHVGVEAGTEGEGVVRDGE